MKIRKACLFLLLSLQISLAQEDAKLIVALVDNSGSYSRYFPKAMEMLKKIVISLRPGDILVIKRISSSSFQDELDEIFIAIPMKKRPMDLKAMQTTKLLKKEGLRKLSKMQFLGSKSTDLTGGIHAASELFAHSDIPKKFLLIFSDLEDNVKEDVDVADLNGVKVCGVSVPRGNDIKHHKQLMLKWKKYFESANCTEFLSYGITESKNFHFE